LLCVYDKAKPFGEAFNDLRTGWRTFEQQLKDFMFDGVTLPITSGATGRNKPTLMDDVS
jgi:hypothetical protein